MARVKVDVPETLPFETRIEVQILHINYGGHMGNDALLSIIQEARIRFLNQWGYSEMDVEGAGIMMSDAALNYKAEVFHGDTLTVQVGVTECSKAGCDMVYRVLREDGKVAALVKTGILFFDYTARKMMKTPEGFKQKVLSG